MKKDNDMFRIQFKAYWKDQLWQVIVFAVVIGIGYLIHTRGNAEPLQNSLGEMKTPTMLMILMPLIALAISIKAVLVKVKCNKILYDEWFFRLFNTLLSLSISTSLARLLNWDSQGNLFKNISPLFSSLDVLDWSFLPVILLLAHLGYDCRESNENISKIMNYELTGAIFIGFCWLVIVIIYLYLAGLGVFEIVWILKNIF